MCSHALRIYIVSYPGIIPYIRVCEKQSEDTLRYLKNILYIFSSCTLLCISINTNTALLFKSTFEYF
jgi:hypothetical protein